VQLELADLDAVAFAQRAQVHARAAGDRGEQQLDRRERVGGALRTHDDASVRAAGRLDDVVAQASQCDLVQELAHWHAGPARSLKRG
jgi:hypothetical protein